MSLKARGFMRDFNLDMGRAPVSVKTERLHDPVSAPIFRPLSDHHR
jgi:hypothetical protein